MWQLKAKIQGEDLTGLTFLRGQRPDLPKSTGKSGILCSGHVRLLGLKFQEAGEVSRIGTPEEGLVEPTRGETEGLPRQCGSVFACFRKIGPIRRRGGGRETGASGES